MRRDRAARSERALVRTGADGREIDERVQSGLYETRGAAEKREGVRRRVRRTVGVTLDDDDSPQI